MAALEFGLFWLRFSAGVGIRSLAAIFVIETLAYKIIFKNIYFLNVLFYLGLSINHKKKP